MEKFVHDADSDQHYRYCAQHQLPHVTVSLARKYAYVQFDVYEIVPPQGWPGEQPDEFIIELYKCYARFFNLPDHKFSYAGGSNNVGFSVFKEHAEIFASQLYDYLLRFVQEQQKVKRQSN